MTKLSVNVNKVALLRNARGRDFPSVLSFAERCLALGAHGITLHPRPDQRHARYRDVEELFPLVCERFGRELNVEGYPEAELLKVVKRVRPTQCTLVPDEPGQLTSDHGWDLRKHSGFLRNVIADLKNHGVRVSVFVDYDYDAIELARDIGADRVELYTEPYAEAFGTSDEAAMLQGFAAAAKKAQSAGLGVNAGHDLNRRNLPPFVAALPVLAEVSIGHAFVADALEMGYGAAVRAYRDALR